MPPPRTDVTLLHFSPVSDGRVDGKPFRTRTRPGAVPGLTPAVAPGYHGAMIISVKCFATLSERTPEDPGAVEVPDGLSLAGLMAQLGVDPAQVRLAFVNGRAAAPDQVLAQGDRVGLFPPVGGG